MGRFEDIARRQLTANGLRWLRWNLGRFEDITRRQLTSNGLRWLRCLWQWLESRTIPKS
ncbi:TPA: hypothetical protein ACX6NR_002856 [Photobacterium damselae]